VVTVLFGIRAERSMESRHHPAPAQKGLPEIASSAPAASPTYTTLPVPRSTSVKPVVTCEMGHSEQAAPFGAYFGSRSRVKFLSSQHILCSSNTQDRDQ